VTTLRFPAIEYQQGGGRTLYCFVADGKLIDTFAAVSRLQRDGDDLMGYQRPEVRAHVEQIRKYLEGDAPLLPNALVVAFDDRVTFRPCDRDASHRIGTLTVPLDPENRPGWIVDGQQRSAALREARIASFPVCVVGFIARSEQEQREQFILVNSTKPLPRGLIYELLPGTAGGLPTSLEKRRLPTALIDRLNRDGDSPLRGLVLMPTNPEGMVKDSTLLKLLENSLSNGCLFYLRDSGPDGSPDVDGMVAVLKTFWSAVARVFPGAWGKPPRESRLFHAAGVIALGLVMDGIADADPPEELTVERFAGELERLRPHCRWTEGQWDLGVDGVRPWNLVQNTAVDIRILSNHLMRLWRESRKGRRRKGADAGEGP
jgi:DGQHR domain-containing protein